MANSKASPVLRDTNVGRFEFILKVSAETSECSLLRIKPRKDINKTWEHAELNSSALLMIEWTLCDTFPASEGITKVNQAIGQH